MCGICGVVGRDDDELVTRMTRVLAHRGPDGEGTRTFPARDGGPPASLGHRRLAIIDTSERGLQPMPYARGRYWITYNGELYNFSALRDELVGDGFSFTSETDTEVLLALYARDGEGMLDRLNGIYAFAIWDEEAKELFIVRDRLGVKPLYYTQRGDELYFASEVKSLLEAVARPSLRRDALADYLTFLWVPDPDTIFEGIWKLPPGHCARFAKGRLAVRQYWDVTFEPEERSERDWAEIVRNAVQESVRRQMVSDVPLGAFLSGGIDSSAIVAEMSAASSDPVTTYTVGFAEDDLAHEIVPDDVQYARQVGALFGVDYREETLRPDVVELLPRLIWHMDEPVADPAIISAYLICSAARETLTVILSGMGGDEIFAGYPRHLAARLGLFADILPSRIRGAIRTGVERHVDLGRPGRLRGPRRNLRKLVNGLELDPARRYLTYSSYYRRNELGALLTPDVRGELSTHNPFRRHEEYLSRVAGEHWLNQILYVDQKTFLPCLNLAYTDKMGMAASTEVRVPLLDDDMVALAARIPPELKLKRLRRKYIFKRSMENVLPRDVIWRPKAGFGAPVRSWLVGELKPLVDDLLSPATVAARGIFDPGAVGRLIADNEASRADNALRIWTLLTFELWQQQFLDPVTHREAA